MLISAVILCQLSWDRSPRVDDKGKRKMNATEGENSRILKLI